MISFHQHLPNTNVPMFSSLKVIYYQTVLYTFHHYIIIFEGCADKLFNEICEHPVSMFIKTLKEIDISFLPFESQVGY